MKKQLKRLAVWTCIGMFLVLVMGALVTKTESGLECGRDWPLCNGKFVPAYTVGSFIEYSHRLVSGLVGLLLLAAFYGVWRYVKRPDARFYVSAAGLLTVVQAGLGALAVLYPQSPPVMALHFGISLLAFAFTLLLAIVLWRHDPGASPDDELERHKAAVRSLAERTPQASRLHGIVWIVAIYCYVVVYLGAFVRHTESSGGCGTDWPLCNGELIPEISGATGIVFIHRLGAVLLLLLVGWLAYEAKRRELPQELRTFAAWSLSFTVLQIFSGAFVTFTLGSDWYLLAGLIHAVLIAGLFGTLSYMCALLLQINRVERRNNNHDS